MTKKDYIEFATIIADELQGMREHGTAQTHGTTLVSVAWAMVDIFEKDNPRFDEDRFMGACGFNYIPPRDEWSLAARWGV